MKTSAAPETTAGGEGASAAAAAGKRSLVASRYPALAQALGDRSDAAPSIHDAATAAVEGKDGGRAVDGEVAARVGAHLGADFTGVRVHDDPLTQQATQAMGARAFAYGADVFLGPGEHGGDLGLMAHELTHVAQQGAAGQRAPQRAVQVGDAGTPAEHEADRVSAEVTSGAPPAALIVDDGPVQPGQMLKSQFIEQLRAEVTAAADAELGPIYSAIGCPYIDQYFGRYVGQPAAAGEALLKRFAPSTRGSRSAAEMIPIVVERVRQGVRTWRETGAAPPDLAGLDGGAATGGASAPAQALRAPDGRETLDSLAASLGPGEAVGGAVAARMAEAGLDVAGARIHSGPVAARKADEAGALAFAVGEHVVMGAQAPAAGSLEGDALLAHELAHVAQQADAARDPVARRKPIDEESSAAEGAADATALAAMTGEKRGLLDRLGAKTGLQLQRCSRPTMPANGVARHVSNDITDGPYGWTQEFDATFSDTEINVVLKPKMILDAGVTPEQALDFKTRSRAAFRTHFDNKFIFTDTANNVARRLRVDVNWVDAGEHYQITLHPAGGHSNRRNWYIGDSDTDLAHELGHQLGLKDEYVDATAPDRANGAAPGVHTDNSLMGNYPVEGVGAASVKDRHAQVIAGEIGGAVGRTFTVSRVP
jgi:hypothetical protein